MPRNTTGRVFKRGKVYWIQYGHGGKDVRESSKSTKAAVAKALLRQRIEEIHTGRYIGPAEDKFTFENLASIIETDYKVKGRKSLKPLRTALRPLREHFKKTPATAITTDRVTKYIELRQADGKANATIQRELAALKRAFRLAQQARRIATVPYVPTIEVAGANTREGFFEEHQLRDVLTFLPADLRGAVRFAQLTGWRKAEVLNLKWSQVNFEDGIVRLAPGSTKNREGREFPFGAFPELQKLLLAQRDKTRAVERRKSMIVTHVFHRNGKPIKSMDGAWRKACNEAGLQGWLFHDLRRTAVRNLEAAGVSRSAAMKLTGHKTAAVYARYAIADRVALEEAVAKLAKRHEARTVR
jgi:integrase